MGKPEDLTATIDAPEADRTDALYHIRRVPLPPGELVPEWAVDKDASDVYEAYGAAIDYVVSRHWNSALEILETEGGYSELVLLRSQLQRRLDALRQEANRRVAAERLKRRVADVVKHEADRLGPASRVGDVLEAPNVLEHGVWRWEPHFSGAQVRRGVLPGDEPEQVVIRSAEIDELAAQSGERGRLGLGASWTWEEAVSRTALTVFDRTSELPSARSDLYELLAFRIEVIDQVLREHEVLGRAGPFGSDSTHRIQLDAEQEAFLRAAAAAIIEVEDEARNPSSPATGTRSWSNVRGRIEVALGRSKSYVERVAGKRFVHYGGPAWVRGEGSGRRTDVEIADTYAQFVRVMKAYVKASGLGERS